MQALADGHDTPARVAVVLPVTARLGGCCHVQLVAASAVPAMRKAATTATGRVTSRAIPARPRLPVIAIHPCCLTGISSQKYVTISGFFAVPLPKASRSSGGNIDPAQLTPGG
jgi:hypothetical protein